MVLSLFVNCFVEPTAPNAIGHIDDRNNDNKGPMDAKDVVFTLDMIQREFPNAVVKVDTFDSFIDALMAEKHIVDALPVYTQEMGDTWS